MSFFNSLQQYVTSGVAGLGLSPRRFSLSRQESTEPTQPQPSTDKKETNSTQVHHGFPKVIPAPGTVTPPQSQGSIRRQSRALECLAPPRKGSFRQRHSPVHQPTPPDRPPLVFCKRRLSWPEVDPNVTSGVQETDGSYFESFTTLSWKRDNRRFSAVRVSETRAETLLENEREQPTEDDIERPDEKEQLYVDVLYTIANTVGATPAPGGQFAHYKEEMYLQVQRAFGVSPDRHYRLLNAATEDKPKIVVLTVLVQEADGIEAKDANETLRKYPPLGIVFRKVTKDYHVPEFNFTLKSGTSVWIPAYAIQHDPEHFPDPNVYNPDRFTAEQVKERDSVTWLPFGDGPRNCIGMRFGMMQAKIGLIMLLQNFKFTLPSKTHVPLKVKKHTFLLTPEGGLWLDVSKV